MQKSYIISALLAVLFSIGTVSVLDWKQSKSPTQIQLIEAVPSSQVLYSKQNNGSYQPLDFTSTASSVKEAVVHIKSKGTAPARANNPFEDLFGGSPFGDRYNFQEEQEKPRIRMGSGSGVIISDDGYIVTNNHVIDEADELEVVLNDNRNYTATVIGTDPTTDLALIKINEEDLDYVQFGNSDLANTGEWVLAVGNPFDLTSTVTAGIISAKGRSINILQRRDAIESFIQTDAAINPGNSGGALVNLKGDLIGINTAISSPTGSYSGYGFAVPSNLVKKVIGDLLDYGTVQRGILGITIRNVNGDLAKEYKLNTTTGVYIDSLMEDSAAKFAGVKAKDVIVAVDGVPTESSPQLQEAIANKRPGDKVALSIIRGGQNKTIDVVLRNKNGNVDVVKKDDVALLNVLGVDLEAISPSAAQKMGIAGGLEVSKLRKGKLRSETSIKNGFVITHVNGTSVKSVEHLERLLEDKQGGVMLSGMYKGDNTVYYYAFGL